MKIKPWIYKVALMTFVLAITISFIADGLLRSVNMIVGFVVLLVIVLFGVASDTIGIAVASCDEQPFHAMAAKKIESAKYSLLLIKNAGQVSNFCNDVIGDIAGIISGTALITIVSQLFLAVDVPLPQSIITVVFSAFIAALTVGGKALGKEIALNHSKQIVHHVGQLLHVIDKRLSLGIIEKAKKK